MSLDLSHIKEMDDLVLTKQEVEGFKTKDGKPTYIRVASSRLKHVLLHANDCAEILGYSSPAMAIQDHVYPEYKIILQNKNFKVSDSLTLKIPNRGWMFLSEPGFLQLVQKSKLPSAVAFNKWVLEILIPRAMMTGDGITPPMKKNSILKILQANMDPKFKKDVQTYISNIAKARATVKGHVWKLFTERYNILYDTNLKARLNAFKKKNGIKQFTMREFLDAVGEKEKTILTLKSILAVSNFQNEHDIMVVIAMLYDMVKDEPIEKLDEYDKKFDELHEKLQQRIKESTLSSNKVIKLTDYKKANG